MALIKSRLSMVKKMSDGGPVTGVEETYAERFQRGFLGKTQKKADGGFIEPQPLPVMPNLDDPKLSQILSLIMESLKKKKKKNEG